MHAVLQRVVRAVALAVFAFCAAPSVAAEPPPRPLVDSGRAVDWWFVFKFGAAKPFAGCGPDTGVRACPFGGDVHPKPNFGQQFVFASSQTPKLKKGDGCLGAQLTDPVGATFGQVYKGDYFYVLWNDQFKGDPHVCGKSDDCAGRWGHSKGMLAWNEDGEGLVMQVSTPSWPGSGTHRIERHSGNTLGCLHHNNLTASQHFFALKLNKADLLAVLAALKLASVATDPTNLQVVANGGPADVRQAVNELGQPPRKPKNGEVLSMMKHTLSSGITLIAKPSYLYAPPWQLVSSELDNTSSRAATWWTKPWIYSTTKSSAIKCWPKGRAKPGPVGIALTGEWDGKAIKLNAPSNHAKVGTAAKGGERYVVFGDLNQQGSASPPPDCDASQNGRGGLFFAFKNDDLYDDLADLITGDTAVREPGPNK